jgi:hypothetical protein
VSADHKHHREENMKMVREFETAVGVMVEQIRNASSPGPVGFPGGRRAQLGGDCYNASSGQGSACCWIAELERALAKEKLVSADHKHHREENMKMVREFVVLVIGTHKLFLGQGTLEFGNPGGCSRR